MTLFAYSQ